MATIHNSDLTKELVTGGRIQLSRDSIPNQLAEKVVPVMEVNPKLLRRTTFCRLGTATNVASNNIFTADSNKETYITGILLSFIKDATSTSTYSQVRVPLFDGSTTTVAFIPTLTLTADARVVFINFDKPILMQKGGVCTVQNATNVANISSSATIYGYEIENSSA